MADVDEPGGVTVTFAGSGDAFGSGGRLQACIVVRAGQDSPVLLDCGASSLIALKRLGIDPNEVAAVFVSHLHVDHFGGVTHMILDGQFRRRTAPLTVVGPAGTTRRLNESLEVMFPGSSGVQRRFPVQVIELAADGSARSVAGTTVRAYGVDHGMQGGQCLALRLSIADKTVAYTGDTGWTDVLLEVAAAADLFIAESYYWDKPVPFHLRHSDLLAHRDQITSVRTVLTHMSDDMLNHAADAAFDLAHDGLRLSL